jgi:small-conductance mechanosensitive channel
MKNKVLIGLSAIMIAAMFMGCAKVPQVEIDLANAAIESAITAGADKYLPDEFAAVKDSMNAIMEAVELQKSKTFAKYGDTKAKLASVVTMANDLIPKTEARIAELKAEVPKKLEEVAALVKEDKDLLMKAPKGKEGLAALNVIKGEIATAEASMNDVTSLLNSGDVLGASNKVNGLLEKLMQIKKELQDAIAKAKK